MSARSPDDFRNPPKAAWGGLAVRIHAGLTASRPHFLSKCIKAARSHSEFPPQIQVLQPPAELAITVCQLLFGRLLIAVEQYFSSPTEGQQFVEAMFDVACRSGSASDRDDLIRRYFKDDDEAIKKFVFGADMARHITGRDAPHFGTAIAELPTEFLRATSWFVVAHAFGDGATAARVKVDLNRM